MVTLLRPSTLVVVFVVLAISALFGSPTSLPDASQSGTSSVQTLSSTAPSEQQQSASARPSTTETLKDTLQAVPEPVTFVLVGAALIIISIAAGRVRRAQMKS